jgi:membrane-associated phospholipid phosphatase
MSIPTPSPPLPAVPVRAPAPDPYWTAAVPALALVLAAYVAAAGVNLAWFHAGQALAQPLPATAWLLLTHLGDTQFALAVVACAVYAAPRWLAAALWAALPATLFVHGIKATLPAARPLAVLGADAVQVIGPPLHAGSFPSGHTATAFVAAGCVVLCLQPRLRRRIGVAIVMLAAVIGYTRVVVGAHWPIDVLVGAAGGWLCAAFGVWASGRWPHLQRPAGLRALAVLAIVIGVTLWLRDFPSAAEDWWARAFGLGCLIVGAATLQRHWRAPRMGPL